MMLSWPHYYRKEVSAGTYLFLVSISHRSRTRSRVSSTLVLNIKASLNIVQLIWSKQQNARGLATLPKRSSRCHSRQRKNIPQLRWEVVRDSRNLLHFLWLKWDNPGQGIVEYMKGHVLGNAPSPSVNIYWLHQAAKHEAAEHGGQALRNFYVDNGLTSLPSVTEAIDLLTRTKEMLTASMRLNKIALNCSDVLRTFLKKTMPKDCKIWT